MPSEDAGRTHAQNFALTGRLIPIQKFKNFKQYFGFKILAVQCHFSSCTWNWICQSAVLRVQPLTLHIGPTGFSFVAKHLDAMLQSSAEVTLHTCTPLWVYIAECPFSTEENESYWVFLRNLLFHSSSPSLLLFTETILAITKLRKS